MANASAVRALFRKCVVAGVETVVGSQPRSHRIPFGPNRGKRIVIAFHVLPRMWVGSDRPSLARWARQYLKPGGVAYDIGAHVRYTSLLFSGLLKGGVFTRSNWRVAPQTIAVRPCVLTT